MIDSVGSDSVQWLDDGSEHPHRIALSVQSSRVPDVCHRLTQGTMSRGVKVTSYNCFVYPLHLLHEMINYIEPTYRRSTRCSPKCLLWPCMRH